MHQNLKKTLIIMAITVIVVIVSAWLGDYAALIMSTSKTVKSGMLCQIIFFIGLITGCLMCLLWQKLDHRYSLQNPDEPAKKRIEPWG